MPAPSPAKYNLSPMNDDLSIRDVRLQKLARMRELGHDPYLVERFDRSSSAKEMLEHFEEGKQVSFAGRVVSYRLMGKAGFAHVSDGDDKIQGYFRKDDLGEVGWELYNLLDVGDHIGASGYLFTTKTGEKSIHVQSLTPLSKSLQNLPLGKEKDGHVFSGLADIDLRYRHRHLDLICNQEARRALIGRMKITSAVRRFLDSRGYLEVETPILQLVAGGAAARPFVTHYNAYEIDVKLRISLELYLKRIICGDIPKVYEIGRVFRNEGVSNRHNPEFTLLEFYEAYINLEEVMVLVEEMFRYVSLEVFGTAQVQVAGDPNEDVSHHEASVRPTVLDFGKPWRRLDLLTAIEDLAGVNRSELQDLASAKAALERVGLPSKKENNLGGIIEKLLERFVEPTLIEPTFLIGYPIETSPLAKKDPSNPKMTRRFEGYVRGREVCNAFSEINDPIDQRDRFVQQVSERAKGDDEAHPLDEEFLYTLEGGMPPTGGCGIGIDRMAMLLTGADHVREVLLFPTMKPVHNLEQE